MIKIKSSKTIHDNNCCYAKANWTTLLRLVTQISQPLTAIISNTTWRTGCHEQAGSKEQLTNIMVYLYLPVNGLPVLQDRGDTLMNGRH